MRKMLLVLAWLPLTSICLLINLVLLNSYSKVKNGSTFLAMQARDMFPKNSYQLYAALPEVLGTFTSAIAKQDARPVILSQFLKKHDSPMAPFAQSIVNASDTKQIDFRLITAIAMCESNLGKKMPEGSYNAFGFAIYTGQSSGTKFDDWEHAINTMASYLSDKYYAKGFTTPEEIGPIYAPPSVNTGNSWAKCVRSFMDELI